MLKSSNHAADVGQLSDFDVIPAATAADAAALLAKRGYSLMSVEDDRTHYTHDETGNGAVIDLHRSGFFIVTLPRQTAPVSKGGRGCRANEVWARPGMRDAASARAKAKWAERHAAA